jgi:hypothetical protein
MSLRDWHSMSLIRRGHPVHQRTDPACVMYAPSRPGSRLDRASRGVQCPRCVPPWVVAMSESKRDPMKDFTDTLAKERDQLLLPMVEWIARRSPWQFFALYVAAGLVFVLLAVWAVTHP